MEILTREIIGQATLGNLTGDGNRTIAVNAARGNALVINEVQLFAQARFVNALSANGNIEGSMGMALDQALLAPGDIPDMTANSDDDDVGEGRGLLELFPFGFTQSAQIDDTNGNASAVASGAVQGVTVDYRQLQPEDRPMTTENPELLINVGSQLTIAMNAHMLLRYQIVRLTERELGQLSGDVRPTVLRVANTSRAAAIRRTYIGS